MVARALVPDYITKPWGGDKHRVEELQDQPESKDIVMPSDCIPEKETPKIMEPSRGMVLKKKTFHSNINIKRRGRRVRRQGTKRMIPTQ